jgi:signal transduction histidine kinase
MSPQTPLEALAGRRLPVSTWPWRSLGYVLATLHAALIAAALLAVPAVPWIVLAGGPFPVPTVALLIVLGFVLVVALGPLIAVPVAATSRWRLAIVDRRPAGHARRMPGGGGVAGWLRARYADPAAWREAGYACLLATVVPAASVAALCTLFLGGIFLASPVTLALIGGRGYVSLFSWRASTVPQSVPFFFAGLVLLVLWSYLVTLVAGADAAVTRPLLFGGGPEERLRAELTEVAASRARLAGAFEAERRRIERDLHDGAQQKLVALTMQLGLARLDLPPRSAAEQAVTAAHEQARQLMAELRDLIHGIQPQVLTDLGLPAALSELADQAPVPVTVYSGLTGRLPGQAENTAYFAAAEALTNVAKHSGAANASVTALAGDGVLVLEVRDDGQGGADPATGSGLTGLADRVAVADGRMLLSSPPGGPTVLRVEIPCKNTSSWHP